MPGSLDCDVIELGRERIVSDELSRKVALPKVAQEIAKAFVDGAFVGVENLHLDDLDLGHGGLPWSAETGRGQGNARVRRQGPEGRFRCPV